MSHPFKRSMLPVVSALIVAGAAITPLAAQQPSPGYKRDLPAALVKLPQ